MSVGLATSAEANSGHCGNTCWGIQPRLRFNRIVRLPPATSEVVFSTCISEGDGLIPAASTRNGTLASLASPIE